MELGDSSTKTENLVWKIFTKIENLLKQLKGGTKMVS